MKHQRISKKPPPVITQWVVYLKRSMLVTQVQRLRITEDALVLLAGHLAIVGTPSEEIAIRVYHAMVKLLFSWRRLQWQKGDTLLTHIRVLPTTSEGLQHLMLSVEAAEDVERLDRSNFVIKHFVEVASKLPDPKAYVEVCKSTGLVKIREIFHPNTMASIAGRFRGVVGDLADPKHRAQALKAIKTIR